MIYLTQQITASRKYFGNTLTDEMLLDFAKKLWENNLITSELIFDEGVAKVKLNATCIKTKFEETKIQDNTDEPKNKPWLKKIFDKK